MDERNLQRGRRKLIKAAGATAGLAAAPLVVRAQGADEIVIGGSIPMTGVFAFAGIGINAAIADYVKLVNDAGGIGGHIHGGFVGFEGDQGVVHGDGVAGFNGHINHVHIFMAADIGHFDFYDLAHRVFL